MFFVLLQVYGITVMRPVALKGWVCVTVSVVVEVAVSVVFSVMFWVTALTMSRRKTKIPIDMENFFIIWGINPNVVVKGQFQWKKVRFEPNPTIGHIIHEIGCLSRVIM